MDSYMKQSIFKDAAGMYNLLIIGKIYFDDKESYFLTSKLGARWRYQTTNFTQGDEHDRKWQSRIHSYIDRVLNTMGLTRDNATLVTFETEWRPWGQGGGIIGSYRHFKIEIETDKTTLPRNQHPF